MASLQRAHRANQPTSNAIWANMPQSRRRAATQEEGEEGQGGPPGLVAVHARKVKSKNIIYQNIVILIYFKHLDKARFFVWFSFNFTGILT